ncbi:MAG: hypothetical protein RLZZ599_1307 [Bacteroidota bacterium]|jgi:translation initiation factor 1
MGKKNKPKKINLEDLGGFVFSTNPDFEPPIDKIEESAAPEDQLLECLFEKKGRGGRQVVIIRGYEGSVDALKELGKTLKQHCGAGGAVKDGEILLQGNVRDKAMEKLQSLGYKTKRIGG